MSVFDRKNAILVQIRKYCNEINENLDFFGYLVSCLCKS